MTPYTPQTWSDGDPAYPASAARFAHMETGIQAAQVAADIPELYAPAPTGVGATDTAALAALITQINGETGGAIVLQGASTTQYAITSALPQITKPLRLRGIAAGIVPASAAGTVLNFAAGVPGLNFAAAAQMSEVSDLYLKSASTVLGTDDGIISLAHALSLRNVVIDGFGRDGVHMDTTSAGNCNNSTLHNVRAVSNKRDGYRLAGGNSNVITFQDSSAVSNGGWGHNSGSAACLFLNAHADSNASGAYIDTGNGNAFILPYTETGTGSNVTLSGTGTFWLEGTFSSSVITNTATNANVLKGGAWLKALRLTDPVTGHKWAINVGSYGAGYLSLADNTNSQDILDIDANNVRAEWLIPLLLTGGVNGTTGTSTPSAGGAGALPPTPAGYLTVKINGVSRQIAYY